MPLRDHFHAPLYPYRHWEGFHSKWANAISDLLNETLLPKGYFSDVQVHVGSRVEVDVGTFEAAQPGPPPDPGPPGGSVATMAAPAKTWAPPAPAMVLPAFFPDAVEVLVYNMESGYTLVGAVEIVSPGNKDRAEARASFAAKCVTHLREGVGLVTIDVVTSRRANLHGHVVRLLGAGDEYRLAGDDDDLRAVAYRPVRRAANRTDDPTEQIQVWPAPLAVGQALPTLPLWLDRGLCLPLDLEATYDTAVRRSRLD